MRLTRHEFDTIEKRVNEINALLEHDLDWDICDNLEKELDEYVVILKKSLKAIQIAERGLTLC
jgi:hypothetical protein